MKNTLLILLTLIIFFTGCKKENQSPILDIDEQTQNQNSAADFTITASDIDFTVGSTWAYSLATIDFQYVNMSSANPNLSYSYTTNTSYTISVIRDTIISPNITGKILLTAAAGIDDVNNYIREVWYYEPLDLKWHDILYERYNGGTEIVSCLGINLPLTPTSSWQNTHTSHPSSGVDSCYALGFDNASCGLGNIKCIKFQSKTVNDNQNTYWYNNLYGKIKTQNTSYIYDNGAQTLTGKTSTMTLTSFHN